MDFNDTPEEAAYRKGVRSWLSQNAPAKGEFARVTDDTARVQYARDWQRKKLEGGYSCITWAKEIGGQGGTAIQSVIYSQEEGPYEVPRGYFDITFGMCLPTVLAVGKDEEKARFVPPALRGEELWCQLFSEPAAGSDLAGLRTRAVPVGDEWIINGQKVWTSGAHFSDFGLLLVRTDPNVPKHKGMTMFWIDMKAPGIDIRPIKQMSGRSGFNEVYFADLRISDSQRLGAVGDGWRVSLVTLMNERLSIGAMAGAGYIDAIATANEIDGPQGLAASQDPVFRDKVADWYIASQGVRLTGFRTMTALSRGETPGPESSISKVVTANTAQALAHEMLQMQGLWGLMTDSDIAPGEAKFQNYFLQSPGGRLAGGTDEILRNIIAERVLGLPGDIRVDKNVPFKDIPTR